MKNAFEYEAELAKYEQRNAELIGTLVGALACCKIIGTKETHVLAQTLEAALKSTESGGAQ